MRINGQKAEWEDSYKNTSMWREKKNVTTGSIDVYIQL